MAFAQCFASAVIKRIGAEVLGVTSGQKSWRKSYLPELSAALLWTSLCSLSPMMKTPPPFKGPLWIKDTHRTDLAEESHIGFV